MLVQLPSTAELKDSQKPGDLTVSHCETMDGPVVLAAKAALKAY